MVKEFDFLSLGFEDKYRGRYRKEKNNVKHYYGLSQLESALSRGETSLEDKYIGLGIHISETCFRKYTFALFYLIIFLDFIR